MHTGYLFSINVSSVNVVRAFSVARNVYGADRQSLGDENGEADMPKVIPRYPTGGALGIG